MKDLRVNVCLGLIHCFAIWKLFYETDFNLQSVHSGTFLNENSVQSNLNT